MSMNILPSLGISSRTMPIGGSFNTPLLNGALFHQSTFRDLFGLKGVSFTAGLRLDYERMKMDYNSGTSLDYKVGIKGEMKRGDVVIREIEMMPETALTVESRYKETLIRIIFSCCPSLLCSMTLRETEGMFMQRSAKVTVREATTCRCSPTCCNPV